ncbi:hypothetical protein CIT26_01685 [Mesorhizobium temperatum]|uniref:Uncharacterized protein n=1 Tax=Mesorhizobium temperatum TaxID=241416 RepID=A0A271LY59_9HYPH|nr:hypothetical protein CIT26_01685 [Mesorhizobium temperatum]
MPIKQRRLFALGEPVAKPTDRLDYIRRFVEVAGNARFVQVGEQTACARPKSNRAGCRKALLAACFPARQ